MSKSTVCVDILKCEVDPVLRFLRKIDLNFLLELVQIELV